MPDMNSINTNILIIGAGPAGLATAIEIAKHNQNVPDSLSIVVVEKASAVGQHNISGAILNPAYLNSLVKNWRNLLDVPTIKVNNEKFIYLKEHKATSIPMPKALKHLRHDIISISSLCRMLAKYAQELGVQILTSCSAQELLTIDNAITGIRANIKGPGNSIEITAEQTILAEGTRGSLTETVLQKYRLRPKQTLSFALGIKEIWEVAHNKHQPGLIMHFYGYPLNEKAGGNGYLYHLPDNKIAVGLTVNLDYKNPQLDPAKELQQLKMHPYVQHYFQSGEFLAYGAGCMNTSGFQAIPTSHFPGGLIVGCAAGLMNNASMQGIHNAIYSGMLAGKTILANRTKHLASRALSEYSRSLRKSPLYKELYRIRNVKHGFRYGLKLGVANVLLDQYILRGSARWTLNSSKAADGQLQSKAKSTEINYPEADGKISLDKATLLTGAKVNYNAEQASHLNLKIPSRMININYNRYGSPELSYCPTGVYEITTEDEQPKLLIHPERCIHCKCCAIKDPTQNIDYQPAFGGNGPQYEQM